MQWQYNWQHRDEFFSGSNNGGYEKYVDICIKDEKIAFNPLMPSFLYFLSCFEK